MKTTKRRHTTAGRSRGKAAASSAKAVLAPSRAKRIRINPKWAWHYRVLLELRDRLRAQRGQQLQEAAEPLEPHSMDIADTATDEFDHDLALSHLSAEQNALYEVEQALRHIRDGKYGVCEATGKRIPPARLRAIPWARFCHHAQARLEQKGAGGQEHLGKPASVRESTAEGFEEAEAEGEPQEEPGAEDEVLSNVGGPRKARPPAAKKPSPKRPGHRR